jgi:hypothetical protein
MNRQVSHKKYLYPDNQIQFDTIYVNLYIKFIDIPMITT